MKSKTSNIKCDNAEEKFECEFCNKAFQREKSLINHACEQKRRWMWKDDKYAMMAFRSYQLFYELSMRVKKPKTQHEFIKSQYYSQFVKYGKYLVDINAIDPDSFTRFLIKLNVKLSNWTDIKVYEVWVVDYGKSEHYEKAFSRVAKVMDEWAQENNREWFNFFREISPYQATLWIKSGKIPPWALFTIGQDLLSRLSDEQLVILKDIIDVNFWMKKIKENTNEILEIQEQFSSVGV